MPRAPLGVTATIDLTDKATVSWDAVAGATSYSVYKSATPTSAGATLLASGVTATSYDDSTLGEEVVRYYFVKAVDGSGTSAFSGMATAWREFAAPDAPTLDAAPQAGYVYFWWAPVARAIFYEVYRDGVFVARIQDEGQTTFEYEDFDVTPHTPYVWQVFGGNFTALTGSNTVETEANDPVPDAPDDVAASDGAFPSKVVVSWSAVPYADEYDVYRNGSLLAASVVGTSTSYDDIVASGTTYTYKVKARGESGTSGFSNEDTGYAGGLAAPTGVVASDDDYDKVTIDWDAVTAATSYSVYRNGSLIASGVTALTYDHIPVAGDSASYTVVAVNSVESSGASSADTGTRPFLPAPTGFSASDDQTSDIDCAWSASAGATEYDLWLNGSIVVGNIVGTSYSLSSFGLTTCQVYSMWVTARRVVTGIDDNTSSASNTDNGRYVPASELCLGGAEVRSGGEVSHDESFNFCGGNWSIYFNAFASIKDQCDVYINGALLWSSGCITGEASQGFATSVGYHVIRVVVTHRCDAGDPNPPTTSWTFTLQCT